MPEQETTIRADALRPGDRIHYAGGWRTARTVATVTSVRTEEGWKLDFEPDQELTVRGTELIPAEISDSALLLIAERSCEVWTTGAGSCTRDSRRYARSQFGAYRWCLPCVAWAALHGVPLTSEPAPAETSAEHQAAVRAARTMLGCTQCGQPWRAPACGPTHALVQAERAEGAGRG